MLSYYSNVLYNDKIQVLKNTVSDIRIQMKNEDKNRFILNKEIVEKYKIVEISKYYLKGNIPSTVDVLRAGK